MTAPLIMSMGEPAGIGGELALAVWLKRAAADIPPFVLIDDPRRLAALAAIIGLDVPIEPVGSPAAGVAVWPHALPVLPIDLPAPVEPGRLDQRNAAAVIKAIEMGVRLTRACEAAALVTNPIQKSVLLQSGFSHPGHTEFLAALDGAGQSVMLLAVPGLRVVPVTIHQGLGDAIRSLTPDLLRETLIITDAALRRDFGIAEPRLAVAGLNPHAGENGAFGPEEATIIRPVLDDLREEGLMIAGPLPADTMFHAAARARYDVAVCMYHDQALIPLKTVDFERGVNVTLGLSFIRTSPDHGTALDIAGSGTANPASLIEALRLARQMVESRQRFRVAA